MMRTAGVDGPIVPWDDILHEGPVPAGLNTAALRDVRANFLAACGWDSRERIARQLAERDAALDIAVDEIVLWFELDLYDQLQVLQILDRLPLDGPPRITAVPADEHLGHLSQDRFDGLFAARRDVNSAQRSAALDAWKAFRAADPRGLIDVLPRVTVLPHLGPAILRHLQQFPSLENGLSRIEHQALEAMAAGVKKVREIFIQSHVRREPAFFMGDSAFAYHLSALARTTRPLIRVVTAGASPRPARLDSSLAMDDEIELTAEGRGVLDEHVDRIALCGIDRWLGGVQLSGTGPVWRWDADRQQIRIG